MCSIAIILTAVLGFIVGMLVSCRAPSREGLEVAPGCESAYGCCYPPDASCKEQEGTGYVVLNGSLGHRDMLCAASPWSGAVYCKGRPA